MAQKTVVELIDDVDGSEATQSLTFSLDGVDYEIDLNDDNAGELRSSLAKFAEAARRTGGRRRPVTDGKAAGISSKDIRAWALSEGLEVNARGRIQASVVDAYLSAN
ncbi:Lsr2 family protein [Paenarthrobacter sp. YJN-5]|uniref:histone-like nucleoid-structuring protein Lsr2 n=1 Tax=Paenarthrobacter sp. YJN-5 TaxID=2735316 RepID=UPI001877C66A|nr:Lsr2 family protein [Paenarthrobacter sp. YJN-5]QOT19326.1 Lsr2 family protein [Paenarthrobacter sp. YJN-5]